MDPRRNTPRHIVILLPKIKDERILKAAREKESVTYKRVPIKLPADFSKEILQARRGWKKVFPVRAHAWVAGQVPSGGHMRGNHTLIFLSLSFFLPSPLSKNK